MMGTTTRLRWGALTIVAALSVAATSPRALGPATGGLWQVARSAKDKPERSLCVARPALLAQYQHRGRRCELVVTSDVGNIAVVNYTCADGGFGRSELTLLTPRTLRIATQGIAADGPFNYVIHARRTGACAVR